MPNNHPPPYRLTRPSQAPGGNRISYFHGPDAGKNARTALEAIPTSARPLLHVLNRTTGEWAPVHKETTNADQ